MGFLVNWVRVKLGENKLEKSNQLILKRHLMNYGLEVSQGELHFTEEIFSHQWFPWVRSFLC